MPVAGATLLSHATGRQVTARALAAVNAGGARRANTAALLRPVAGAEDLAERPAAGPGTCRCTRSWRRCFL